MHNQVLFFSKNQDIHAKFRTGVSLHGHTKHSLESLGFIGKYLQEHRGLRSWIAQQSQRSQRESGIAIDFARAYWTPPLTAELAYDLEFQQITSIGLKPMVSLSDHNNIQASASLRLLPGFEDVPISVEWTVPFGKAVFHIGVHNMPSSIAPQLMATLSESSTKANEQQITDLVAELQRIPSVLLVFNHPVWNFNGIRQDVFDFELRRFLQGAGKGLHAFELNGMRSHRENSKVIRLASKWNQLVVSGGDRHACEPNAMLNLTDTADFSEFVSEIRDKRRSTVLMMAQYNDPLNWRFFRGFADVIREYPEHPEGQRKWDERTFHPNIEGNLVPLTELWANGSPKLLKNIFKLAIMGSAAPAHSVMRALMSAEQRKSLTLPHAFAAQVDIRGESFVTQTVDQLSI